MTRATIAYQGQPGAFSEEACRRFASDFEPRPYADFAAVAVALAGGAVDAAMLPVRNRIAGPVPGIAALLAQHGFAEAQRARLPITMELMALPGVPLDAIRRGASHPMALRQCRGTLAQLGIAPVAASDTAGAARDLVATQDRELAVIASQAAAALYRLTILVENIHDQPHNWTEFVLLRPAKKAFATAVPATGLRPGADSAIRCQ